MNSLSSFITTRYLTALVTIGGIILLSLAPSSKAFAHALYVVAQVEDNQVTGIAYYSDQIPVKEGQVIVAEKTNPDNKVEGKTDETGNFTLTLPKALQDEAIPLQVTISGSPGHQATIEVPRLSPSATSVPNDTSHSTSAHISSDHTSSDHTSSDHTASAHSHPPQDSSQALSKFANPINEEVHSHIHHVYHTHTPLIEANSLSEESLKLLRQDIAQLKDKLYFHDIISGIGYLVGIFGVYAFWLSRRQPKSPPTHPTSSQKQQ